MCSSLRQTSTQHWRWLPGDAEHNRAWPHLSRVLPDHHQVSVHHVTGGACPRHLERQAAAALRRAIWRLDRYGHRLSYIRRSCAYRARARARPSQAHRPARLRWQPERHHCKVRQESSSATTQGSRWVYRDGRACSEACLSVVAVEPIGRANCFSTGNLTCTAQRDQTQIPEKIPIAACCCVEPHAVAWARSDNGLRVPSHAHAAACCNC